MTRLETERLSTSRLPSPAQPVKGEKNITDQYRGNSQFSRACCCLMENAKLARSFGCADILNMTIANVISAFGHCGGSLQKIIFVLIPFSSSKCSSREKKIIRNCAQPLNFIQILHLGVCPQMLISIINLEFTLYIQVCLYNMHYLNVIITSTQIWCKIVEHVD